jgi:hypothetical protein
MKIKGTMILKENIDKMVEHTSFLMFAHVYANAY